MLIFIQTLLLLLIWCQPEDNRAEAADSRDGRSCRGIGVISEDINRCEGCHARGRVAEPDDMSAACDFCHSSGVGSDKKVRMTGAGCGGGHRLGYTGFAPDTDRQTPYTVVNFSCLDCHVSHGDSQKAIKSYDKSRHQTPRNSFLRGKPNLANTIDHNFEGEDVSLTNWCSSCHEGNGAISNDGAPKDHRARMIVYDEIADDWVRGFSHDCSPRGSLKGGQKYAEDGSRVTDTLYLQVEPLDDANQGPTCQECHSAPAFPHEGNGIYLSSGSQDNQTSDGMCLDCHKTDTLP